MHDHDLELIAALAEGDLGLEEAAAAEREIATCESCSAEFEAQRTALAAIADAPRPGLSMAESGDLRRAVRTAVGAEPEPAAQPTRRPWLGLVTAAAVVALLLAVVPAANLLRTDGDSAASDTTIAEESRDAAAFATTSPPATEAPAAEMAPATTVVATEAPTAGAAEDGDTSLAPLPTSVLRFTSVTELEQLLSEVVAGIEVDGLNRSLRDSEFQYFADRLQVTAEEAPTTCPITSVLEAVPGGTSVVTVGTGELDGAEVIVVVASTQDGVVSAAALDATSCEIISLIQG